MTVDEHIDYMTASDLWLCYHCREPVDPEGHMKIMKTAKTPGVTAQYVIKVMSRSLYFHNDCFLEVAGKQYFIEGI